MSYIYNFWPVFPSSEQGYLYKWSVALEDGVLDRALAKRDLADLRKVVLALQCVNKTKNIARILLDR